jgi:hypothetical protein
VNGPGNGGTGQESGVYLAGSIQGSLHGYGEFARCISCKYAMRLMHFAMQAMDVVSGWVRASLELERGNANRSLGERLPRHVG